MITGFSGGRGFAEMSPADVARSRILSEILDPVDCCLFGGAITCGNVAFGVIYLKIEIRKRRIRKE